MRKKLTRSSFSALSETTTLLDEQQQRTVIGGDYWDDHGIWQLDSNGNSYWTRTSQGDGYYYGDSGYYNGSGYNGDSGYYGNYGNSGNSSISPVLSASNFSGYQTSDPAGCQTRCAEMLKHADVSMDGGRIYMVSNVDGRAGNALSTANQGIDAINAALESGDPIIVGVDYKKGNYNGGFEDHFIVIVGRTVSSDGSVQYRYFDPRTGYSELGTSQNNILTLTADGKLTGTFPGSQNNYIVTSVRTNK